MQLFVPAETSVTRKVHVILATGQAAALVWLRLNVNSCIFFKAKSWEYFFTPGHIRIADLRKAKIFPAARGAYGKSLDQSAFRSDCIEKWL